jgi:hypothetical protein
MLKNKLKSSSEILTLIFYENLTICLKTMNVGNQTIGLR